MNIIFLDIDGVLNWGGTEELAPSGCIGVEDMMIRNLKKIVDDTNAKIVLTSTWKSEWSKGADYKSEDFKYLESRLREFNITIFDKTNDHISNRGEGIKKYLHAHSEITNWVVIDDIIFDDYDDEICEHFVNTDYSYYGLTFKLALKAIEILNN